MAGLKDAFIDLGFWERFQWTLLYIGTNNIFVFIEDYEMQALTDMKVILWQVTIWVKLKYLRRCLFSNFVMSYIS